LFLIQFFVLYREIKVNELRKKQEIVVKKNIIVDKIIAKEKKAKNKKQETKTKRTHCSIGLKEALNKNKNNTKIFINYKQNV